MDLTWRQRTSVLQQPPSSADRKSQGGEHCYHPLCHKTPPPEKSWAFDKQKCSKPRLLCQQNHQINDSNNVKIVHNNTSFEKILRQSGLLDLEKKKLESFVRDLRAALQYHAVLRGWQDDAQQENERQEALIGKKKKKKSFWWYKGKRATTKIIKQRHKEVVQPPSWAAFKTQLDKAWMILS